MEADKSKRNIEKKDNEIIYSKALRAGKRIYYLDVKKSINEDLFIAITESKKMVYGTDENAQVTFEKHKVFLYKEDFNKFLEGLTDVIEFAKKEQGEAPPRLAFNKPKKQIDLPAAGLNNEEEINNDDDEREEEIPTPKKSFFDKFKF